MAQYQVVYSCGHEGTVSLFGRHADRERKLLWYANTATCPACYAERQRREREEAGVAAGQWSEANRLPKLQGTEPQVEWAERVRREVLQPLLERLERQPIRPESDRAAFLRAVAECPIDALPQMIFADFLAEQGDDAESARWRAIGELLREDSSGWWIDQRNRDWRSLADEIVERPAKLADERKAAEERRAAELKATAEAEEKVKRLWAAKQKTADECRAILNEGYSGDDREFHVETWGTAERRLYIRRSKAKFGANCVSYYHTGSSRNRPRSVEAGPKIKAIAAARGITEGEARAALVAFCEKVMADWKNLDFDTSECPPCQQS